MSDTTFEQLAVLTTRLGDGSDDEIQQALHLARAFFDLDVAIVSQIEGDRYTVQHFEPQDSGLHKGQIFALGDTYCALTVAADDVVTIEEMRSSEFAGHPCYAAFGLESYVGVPLIVHGERYGTLNFSSPKARQTGWTETERGLLRLLAGIVRRALERRALLATLEASSAALRKNQEALEAFASRAGHDLKGPLRRVSALVEWTLEDDGEAISDEGTQNLREAQTRLARLANLVTELLAYTKAGYAPSATPVDVAEAAQVAVDDVAIPEGKVVEVAVDGPPVQAAAPAVQLIVRNLVSNALHHGGDRIRVTGRREGRFHVLRVADDGPGIAEQYHEQVFHPFETLKTGTSGLGLAMVKRVAESNGGSVAIEPSDEGAVFRVSLPRFAGG